MTVNYIRKEDEVTLEAVPSDPSEKWREIEAAQIWAGFKVWTLRASALVIDGDLTLPQRGDQIEDSEGNLWQVTSPDGAPIYRYVDPEQIEIEVATKLFERG